MSRHIDATSGGPYGGRWLAGAALLAALLSLAAMASRAAMAPLVDEDLAGITGEGLAFAATDFRLQMAPTSYVEQFGDKADGSAGSSGFRRGDLRWYGLTLGYGTEQDTTSGAGAVDTAKSGAFTHWDGATCTLLAGNESLSCPQATNGVALLAAYDNPYVFRAYDYTGQTVDTATDGTAGTAAGSRTVLELLSPSNSDIFRWAFWGEAESGKRTSGTDTAAEAARRGMLQSQSIIVGKASSPAQNTVLAGGCTASNCTPSNARPGTVATPRFGSVLRFYQVANNTANTGSSVPTPDPTLGLFYHHRLSGDFRFSVNQDNASAASGTGVPVRYTTTEGLYFKGVSVFLPLGQLHYQSIIFDSFGSGATAGNFTIEVTRPPTNSTAADDDAYKDFYSLSACADARYTGANCGYQRQAFAARPARYWETHGYSIWGTLGTANDDVNGSADTVRAVDINDGIYFRGVANFVAIADRPDPAEQDANPPRVYGNYTSSGKSRAGVNLGDSFIEGILIQHLKITSCGAGTGNACQ
ncbi:MAG: hypothetical protein ACOY33_04865 [Pseudomonadota bacterium]